MQIFLGCCAQRLQYRGAGLDDVPCSIVVAEKSADDDGTWLPKLLVKWPPQKMSSLYNR